MIRPLLFCLLAGLATAGLVLHAQDAANPRSDAVAKGLDNPSGLAIHPNGDIFIAARDGIHRLSGGKLTPEITGFKTDIYGKGPMYNIGPLGVGLLDDSHLIVGDGSLPDASEVALVYKVGPKAPAKPAGADSAVLKLGPIGPGEASAKGEGNFYGVAVTREAVYFTSNGDDTKGWVLRTKLTNGKPGELEPFIATKTLVNVDAPVGITMSPDGKHIVVGQMGEVNMAGDSLLTMYDLEGKLVSSAKTGLSDIAALAYSPKTKKLYCVDFSWVDTKQGGLYRLDVAGSEVKATKIASLDKPTAMAFDKEGNLYVTVYGTAEGDKPAGSVLKFAAGL